MSNIIANLECDFIAAVAIGDSNKAKLIHNRIKRVTFEEYILSIKW